MKYEKKVVLALFLSRLLFFLSPPFRWFFGNFDSFLFDEWIQNLLVILHIYNFSQLKMKMKLFSHASLEAQHIQEIVKLLYIQNGSYNLCLFYHDMYFWIFCFLISLNVFHRFVLSFFPRLDGFFLNIWLASVSCHLFRISISVWFSFKKLFSSKLVTRFFKLNLKVNFLSLDFYIPMPLFTFPPKISIEFIGTFKFWLIENLSFKWARKSIWKILQNLRDKWG